ncbi:hypothetical protein CKA32_000657 [Geitlerinema sp. FC II]|nr:hypothetical protein CKA32_000657 [Geitlerinema sp. FC II]
MGFSTLQECKELWGEGLFQSLEGIFGFFNKAFNDPGNLREGFNP